MADELSKLTEPITPDDVDREVDNVMRLVDEQAKKIRAEQDKRVLEMRRSSPVRTSGARKPDASDLIRAGLRSALSDEVVVAPSVVGEDDIEPSEFGRELMKRALMKLKLSDLREEAKDRGVDWRGTEEDVASRLAAALRFDEQRIAELVLSYERETEPPTGFNERIYRLSHEVTDLGTLSAGVERMVRRYVRVGVAKWFVFQSVRSSQTHISVSGLFRSFRAEASDEHDDYTIHPIEVSARASTSYKAGKRSRTCAVEGCG